MKEFSMEVPKGPETEAERLFVKVSKFLKNVDNEIAVEVYGSGIGRPDEESVTNEQLQSEAEQIFAERRDEFSELLESTNVLSKALELYRKYASGDMGVEELQTKIKELLLSSSENLREVQAHEVASKKEFEQAKAKLSAFLDKKILEHQSNRAMMSKWGNAKLAYEKGDSSKLKEILIETKESSVDVEEQEMIDRFLKFLEHQRFEE